MKKNCIYFLNLWIKSDPEKNHIRSQFITILIRFLGCLPENVLYIVYLVDFLDKTLILDNFIGIFFF